MVRDKFTKKEFESVKEIVEFLLANDERCRNDDKYLTFKVMQKFTDIYIPFEDFGKIPAFETVKRIRAHIQNVEGRFLPTDAKVRERRKKREMYLRELYSSRARRPLRHKQEVDENE